MRQVQDIGVPGCRDLWMVNPGKIKRTRMFAPMGIFALALSPLNPQAFPHGGLVTKGSMPLLPIRLHLPTLVLRLGHSYGGQVSYLGSP